METRHNHVTRFQKDANFQEKIDNITTKIQPLSFQRMLNGLRRLSEHVDFYEGTHFLQNK